MVSGYEKDSKIKGVKSIYKIKLNGTSIQRSTLSNTLKILHVGYFTLAIVYSTLSCKYIFSSMLCSTAISEIILYLAKQNCFQM